MARPLEQNEEVLLPQSTRKLHPATGSGLKARAIRQGSFHRSLCPQMLLLVCLTLPLEVLTGCSGGLVLSPSASTSGTGLVASPSSLSYGTLSVGQSASQSASVVNTTQQPVVISSISVTDPSFKITDNLALPLTLEAGQSQSLHIVFQPANAGDVNAQVLVTFGSSAQASAQVQPASGSSNQGSTTISLKGSGKAAATAALTMSSLSCTTASFTSTGIDSCTATLNAPAPSGGVSVSLSSDNSALAVPGSVKVTTNTPSATFTVNVAAVTSPQAATLQASINGTSASFVLQLGPSTSTTAPTAALSSFVCANTSLTGAVSDACTVGLSGPAPSTGFAVNLASSSGSVSLPASVLIPANATSASFAASATAVTTTQTITLQASAGGVTQSVTLQLNAVAPVLTVNATSVNFGSVNLNTPSTQSVVLSSTGTGAVTVSGASASGTGFSITGGSFPITLNPGQSATLNVQFDPTATGSATGQLTIVSNSSTATTMLIALSGTGLSVTHSVTLTWDPPSSSTDPVANFSVYRASGGSTSYQSIGSTPASQTTYVDNTVVSGQTYDYVVRSVDASGVQSSPSNMTAATIP